jgi:hypothetical protein
MEQEMTEQAASPETRHDVTVITPSQGEVIEAPPAQEMPCPTCAGGAVPCPTFMLSAGSKHVSRTSPRKRNLPRLPDGHRASAYKFS